jgi:hypothetical protein
MPNKLYLIKNSIKIFFIKKKNKFNKNLFIYNDVFNKFSFRYKLELYIYIKMKRNFYKEKISKKFFF